MKNIAMITGISVLLFGCGGGGGGGSDDISSNGTGTLTLAIADAPVDDADSVVITVDKVLLRGNGSTDVTIDRFTIPTLGLVDADTFQIDLLDYRNGNRLLIVDDLVVPAGTYGQLILQVLDEDVNYSYVDALGKRTPIKQPSEQLKLGGFTVVENGVYAYTLDFDLRKAMTYNPGPDRYILKPRGVRLVNEQLAVTLEGSVDSALFNTAPECAGKLVPTEGNVVYLYAGHDLSGQLADAFDPDVANGVPASAINPYAAVNVYQEIDNSWHYHFGYLPAGDYTLAFSCNAEDDYADTYDDITIPLPATQRAEVTLTARQQAQCNLPISGGLCAP